MPMDEDQQWLINCLNASLDPNHQVRTFAEASLQQASLQPGYGVALARVTANRELSFGLRQLAAVLLKQYIKKHWKEDEEGFQHPAVPGSVKSCIREILLASLDDSYKKISTAVSVAISTIAAYDWPDEWPELLPFLISLVTDQTKQNGVNGALKCLALISSDMDDVMAPKLFPALFPSLHTIISSPQIYEKCLRCKAFSVIYNCMSMLGVMSGLYKTETRALMLPMLQPCIEQFSSILKNPVPSEDPDDWSIRTEVLKCLNQFVQNFPDLLITQFSVIMGPLWNTFVSSLQVYERASVQGAEDSYDGRYDSDGAERSLESFVIQLFEFLLTVVGSANFVNVLANKMKELVYYTIGFLQITEQQAHTWSMDANQYVADEDDNTYSCRVSGTLLLEEIATSFGNEGIDAIVDSIKRRIIESQQLKDAGSESWWRLREATLFALSSVSDHLLQSEANGPSIGNILEQVLTTDVATSMEEYPFLHARLFSSVEKLSCMINKQLTEHFLYAAIMTVGMNVQPPVKVGACRALCQLLPDTASVISQQYALGLFSSLIDLLQNASEETIHLVLETLQAAVNAGHEVMVSIEPIISPIILSFWASHVSDPFISIDALEVLEVIKNAPGCTHLVVSRVLQYIGPILSDPHRQPEGLVSGSLDLLTVLVKNSPIDVVKSVCQVSFDSVVRILLQSTDHSEMQNATQCLAAFVSGGKQDILAWGGDPGSVMRSLLDVVSRLLDPDLESSGSLFVGSYILQLILHLPSQMAQHAKDLVVALIRRMQSAQIISLKSSLLLIFSRLVHMSVPHVERFIDLLVTIPAEGHQNSFAYLMTEWTQHQGEVHGAYEIKVTTSALALLLLTKHAELSKINVQGHLVKSQTGITTRSRAKIAPDQWTVIQLPAKILALLADALLEIQEQADGDDESSGWEEVVGEDAGEEEGFLNTAGATSHSRPTYEYLEAMAKTFDKDGESDYEDELLCTTDPLNEMNLVSFLMDALRALSGSDEGCLDHLSQTLTKPQRRAIGLMLRQ